VPLLDSPPASLPEHPLHALLSLFEGRFLLTLIYMCSASAPGTIQVSAAEDFIRQNPFDSSFAVPLLKKVRAEPAAFVEWFVATLQAVAKELEAVDEPEQALDNSLDSPLKQGGGEGGDLPMTLLPLVSSLLSLGTHLSSSTFRQLLIGAGLADDGAERDDVISGEAVRVLVTEFAGGIQELVAEIS
jgi:hypothetical protein